MTEKQKQKIHEHAADTLSDLENIDPAKMSKEQFLLYGAALAIENAQEAAEHIETTKPAQTPGKEENAAENKITQLQRELKNAFDDYAASKEEYTIHQTSDYGKIMIEHLHYLLEVLKGMFKLLWQSSNTESEKEAIRNFFQSYIEKYFIKSV